MRFTTPHVTIKHATIAIGVSVFIWLALGLYNLMFYQTVGVVGNAEPSVGMMGQYNAFDYAVEEQGLDGAKSIGVRNDMMVAPTPPSDGLVAPDSSVPQGDQKLVRTAALDLLVVDTDRAADEVRGISDRYAGVRGNENIVEYTRDLRRGTMSIWVPAEHFDEAVRDIKALAVRVNSELINTQDVSAQHVDLTARLKNLRATESQYQELMTRSGSIADVLQVTRQLSETRQQIEQLEAQLARLTNEVALSEITVTLTPEVQVSTPGQVVNEWRPGAVAKEAYHELQQKLMRTGNALIAFVIVGIPMLIISLVHLAFWALVAWLLYRVARWLYDRMRPTTPAQ